MIGKLIEDITENDLLMLVESQVRESRYIEYKSQLPDNSEVQRTKFLSGLSAFANSFGGDMVFGIKEANGMADVICGIQTPDIDKEILRLEAMLRNNVEPRLSGVTFHPVKLSNGNYVIVVRVLKSWNAPHRLATNSKFYARNSAGKYPMDVMELRSEFLLADRISSKLKTHRSQRLDEIQNAERDALPIYLSPSPKIVLHLLPLESFSESSDLKSLPNDECNESLTPIRGRTGVRSQSRKINIDGLLTYSLVNDAVCCSYVQLYRTGAIEAAAIVPEMALRNKTLHNIWFEKEIVESVSAYLIVLEEMKIRPPITVGISLIGFKGFSLGLSDQQKLSNFEEEEVLDRDLLMVPEILLNEYVENVPAVLKPVFDMFWNAFGYSKSLNFDSENKWCV